MQQQPQRDARAEYGDDDRRHGIAGPTRTRLASVDLHQGRDGEADGGDASDERELADDGDDKPGQRQPAYRGRTVE